MHSADVGDPDRQRPARRGWPIGLERQQWIGAVQRTIGRV